MWESVPDPAVSAAPGVEELISFPVLQSMVAQRLS